MKTKKRYNFTLSDQAVLLLKQKAEREGLSMSSTLEMMLREEKGRANV